MGHYQLRDVYRNPFCAFISRIHFLKTWNTTVFVLNCSTSFLGKLSYDINAISFASCFICVNCCIKWSLILKMNICTRNSYVHDIYASNALKTRHAHGSASYNFWPFKNNVVASSSTITDFTAFSQHFPKESRFN